MSEIQLPNDEYEIKIVTEAVKKLYQNEKTADVHFIFETEENIPAHKYLLAAARDVFDTMFYGSIKEKGDVKIGDVSAAVFMEFLRFFYFNTIKLTMANIFDIIHLGHKYEVAECFNLCVRYLGENLTVDNVHQVHSLAILFEQNELRAKCKNFFNRNT